MFFQDHAPPHFHAEYGEYEALFNIDTLEITKGNLPNRAKVLVLEWAVEHRDELKQNWEKARKPEPLNEIDPLP